MGLQPGAHRVAALEPEQQRTVGALAQPLKVPRLEGHCGSALLVRARLRARHRHRLRVRLGLGLGHGLG
jgi:hypothetical protein